MGVASRGPSIWRLAIWSVGAISLLLLAANSDSIAYVQRRMLLSAAPSAHGGASDPQPLVGRVAGKLVQLPAPSPNATTYRGAFKRCRPPPADGDVLVPALKRAGVWDGADTSRGGNTTVVTTLHADRWALPARVADKVLQPAAGIRGTL